ncbi:type II toxin-antitoxin system YafQ family toxin [Eubacterium barkeri]|uniref:mRNA interferase YafQ n=1 Tax=Eubacterium barkeri TaxID=1528 RepID=A0A1H3FU58_EUBBA|nr:type II toxin-antitoxin system YafQ family toxin [Eubacterium barkeri]SDX94355.1 mRNA interferase YafQ [Eubacterium barkeri]
MYTLKFTTAYKKGYKRIKKRGLSLARLDAVMEMLPKGQQLPDKYYDHALNGSLEGFHECYIQPDWLLIYLIDDAILTLTLVDTGSHSDLFNL